LGGVLYWLGWLCALSVELLLPFDGDGTFVGPMAIIFAVEIEEWYFLSSAAVISSALMIPLVAVAPVFATVPVVAVLPVAPSSAALMVGVTGLFFGYCVHRPVWLCLICVPWLQVRLVTVLGFLLFIHFFDPSPLARSDLQYSCIISKTLSTAFGLRLSRYS